MTNTRYFMASVLHLSDLSLLAIYQFKYYGLFNSSIALKLEVIKY